MTVRVLTSTSSNKAVSLIGHAHYVFDIFFTLNGYLKLEWGIVCQNGPEFGQIASFYLKSDIYSENGPLHLKSRILGKQALSREFIDQTGKMRHFVGKTRDKPSEGNGKTMGGYWKTMGVCILPAGKCNFPPGIAQAPPPPGHAHYQGVCALPGGLLDSKIEQFLMVSSVVSNKLISYLNYHGLLSPVTCWCFSCSPEAERRATDCNRRTEPTTTTSPSPWTSHFLWPYCPFLFDGDE